MSLRPVICLSLENDKVFHGYNFKEETNPFKALQPLPFAKEFELILNKGGIAWEYFSVPYQKTGWKYPILFLLILFSFRFIYGHPDSLLNERIFVDANIDTSSSTVNDGSSWETAFIDLQEALTHYRPGYTIYMAGGTYRPTKGLDRTIYFELKDSLLIYGGFAGVNGNSSNPYDRNLDLYESVLSGDIGTLGDNSDNSYTIMYGDNVKDIYLEGITFRDGNADSARANVRQSNGGAIFLLSSAMTLRKCKFFGNRARDYGGAVYGTTNSDFTIDSCLFESNTVGENANVGIPQGGAITNFDGRFFISHSTFRDNECIGGRAGAARFANSTQSIIMQSQFIRNKANQGGAIFFGQSSPLVSFSSFKENTASDGGAIFIETCSPTFQSCIIKDNFASRNGGGMYIQLGSDPTIQQSVFVENISTREGGGIFNEGGSSPQIEKSIFLRNRADQGGAFFTKVGGVPNISYSLMQGNRAKKGGAIFSTTSNSNPLIRSVSFIADSADDGGAIFNAFGSIMELTNCTLSENLASAKGGGVFNEGALKMNSCTLAGNNIKQGAIVNGGGKEVYVKGGLFEIRNTIVSNTGDSTFMAIESPDKGNFLSHGHNFFDDTRLADNLSLDLTDISNPTDTIFAHAGLGRYGGQVIGTDIFQQAVPTIPILAGSLVHGNGEANDSISPESFFDQRGYARLIGQSGKDSIDIGAYEIQQVFFDTKLRNLCAGDQAFQELPEIIIVDSTGGGLVIGDSLSYELNIPSGLELDLSQTNIAGEGDSIEAYNPVILGDSSLIFQFNRGFTTNLSLIRISGILARVSTVSNFDIRIKNPEIVYQDALTGAAEHLKIKVLSTSSLSQNNPYDDSFELMPEEWFATEGKGKWDWGIPEGSSINTAASGDYALMTGVNNATGSYFAEELSIIESTCFDLSSLKRPMIRMDVWSDSEPGFDGTVLQYSFDAGNSWLVLGKNEGGVNWYNSNSILSNPDNQDDGAYLGWSGRDSSWHKAAHTLDEIPRSGPIRFRLAFASISFVDLLKSNDGFAMDNVFIGEKEKKILIEEFTENDFPHEKVRELLNNNKEDLISITYPLAGSFLDANPAGPRTRALFYGISLPGISALGGSDYLGQTDFLNEDYVETSLLEPANFYINIDSLADLPISIKAMTDVDEESIIYVAITEKTHKGQQIIRKFLPDPAGLSQANWNADDSLSMMLTWESNDIPSPTTVDNYDSLELIVFLQMAESKKVRQVESTKVWEGILQKSAIRKAFPSIEELPNDQLLYPNPAHEHLIVRFGSMLNKKQKIDVLNAQGKWVQSFVLNPGLAEYKIDLLNLPEGLYFLKFHENLNYSRAQKLQILHSK